MVGVMWTPNQATILTFSKPHATQRRVRFDPHDLDVLKKIKAMRYSKDDFKNDLIQLAIIFVLIIILYFFFFINIYPAPPPIIR